MVSAVMEEFGNNRYNQIQFCDMGTNEKMAFDMITDKRDRDEVYKKVMEANGWIFDPVTGARSHIGDMGRVFGSINDRVDNILKEVTHYAL